MLVFRTITITLGYHCGEVLLLSLMMNTYEDRCVYNVCIYSPVCIFSFKTPVSCTGQFESHLLVNMVVSPKC